MKTLKALLKNLSLSLFIFLLAFGVFPQVSRAEVVVDYGYTKTIGGSGYDFGRASVVDSNGNIYITGRFSTTVDFDPGVGVDEHTSIGDNDHFLTKINADGTYGWTKTIKGISTDSISVDSNNNIYLAGCFIGTVDFDFSEDVDEYTSEGECDIFLTKINFDESYGYTKIIGGTGNDGGFSLTIDYDHNIYLVGYFSDTVDFDFSVGIDEHTSEGGTDIFLTKINSNGSYGYTKTVGGNAQDYGYSIDIDSSNNLYITGQYSNTVDFDFSENVDEHTGYWEDSSNNIFITKVNSDGSYGWTQTIEGSGGYLYSNSIAVDSNNNVFICGAFTSNDPDYLTDFDPTEGFDLHENFPNDSGSGYDIFLTKINADESYGFTKTIGGSGDDYGNFMNIDQNDLIYITGEIYSSTIDYDPTEGIDEYTKIGTGDSFLTKINTDGSYGFTYVFDGSSYIIGYGVAFDLQNSIFLVGLFGGTIDFDPSGGVDEHIGDNNGNIFLTKFTQTTIPDEEEEEEQTHTVSGSRPRKVVLTDTPVFSTPITPPIQTSTEPPTCLLTLPLKQGSKGTEVKCLQTLLNQNLVLDGMFGPKTKASVILFQKAHNLIPDGIVGPLTRGELNN